MYKNDFDSNKLNYVVYCRKSSDSEDKQVQSLETQIRELTDHARKNELNIVEIIQESKSAFRTGREGFGRLVKLILSGKVNAILVIRANRISRNAIDAGQIINLMDIKKLLYIRTPSSTCYTCSSTDKMMIGLELLMSKKDSDDKGDMVKEGQKTKAIKGFPHGVASLGFLNDMSDEKGNRKWKVDKSRIDKINLILHKFLAGGITAGRLYDYAVNDLGLTTVSRKKIGGKLIAKSRIYEILKDPIYTGYFFYGGIRYELHKSLPRLITESEHLRISRLLGQNSLPKVQNHQTLYSGLIKSTEGYLLGQDVKLQAICDCKRKFSCILSSICPECDTDISSMSSPKLIEYCYHYDSRKKKAGKQYKYVDEKKITSSLVGFLSSSLVLSPCLVEWSKKHISELKDQELSETLMLEINIEEDKKKYEDDKARAREMLRDGYITNGEYKVDLSRIDDKYKHISKKRNDGDVNWIGKLNEIADFSVSIAEVLKSGSLDQKRTVLFSLGANLIWDEENLYFTWSKGVTTLMDGIKGIREKYPWFEPSLSFAEQGLNEKTDRLKPVFSTMLRLVKDVRTYCITTNDYFRFPNLYDAR